MGNRLNLSTEEFAELVADAGEVPAAYRRCFGACPQCQPARGAFRPVVGCPVCGGTGTIYQDYQAPDGSLTGGRIALQSAQIGRTISGIQVEQGDVSCIFLPDDYPMGDRDRILLASRVHQHSELIERDKARTGSLSDRLRLGPALEIVAVFVPVTGELTTDFTLSDDGMQITWTGTGASPAPGGTFGVIYRFQPAFEVPVGTIYRRVEAEDGGLFPARVVLRLYQHRQTDQATGQRI